MTNERDPIIEIADLREANQQWKTHCASVEADLREARTELLMLSRRNTMLVIEIEALRQRLSRLEPAPAKFDEVKAMNDRLGPLDSLEKCAKDSYSSENSQ